MRVLAARFPDRRGASAALAALRHRLDLSARDAAIAPLGTPGEIAAGETLLAGHFHESDAALVSDVVAQSGGEVVADVDELWTQARPRAASAARSEAPPAYRQEVQRGDQERARRRAGRDRADRREREQQVSH